MPLRHALVKSALVMCACVLSSVTQTGWAAGQWTLTDLGYPPGGGLSAPTGINDAGQIAVSSYGSADRALLWQAGGMNQLSDLQSYGYGYGINNRAQVVGSAFFSISRPGPFWATAALWQNGNAINLGTLPGGRMSAAYGINDAGQVVGSSDTYGSSGQTHAFVWTNGSMVDLGVLPGGAQSKANDINNAGQIVGRSTVNSGNEMHAVLWDGGSMIDLGAAPGAVNGSEAFAINNAGEIAGVDSYRAVVWHQGSKTDLGVLDGDVASAAMAINDLGQVVGYSDQALNGSNDTRAVLWQNGVATDLSNLEDVTATGWRLLNAVGINQFGQIIGVGITPTGFYQGYLLTPVPEAQTGAMLAIGLAAVLGVSQRRRKL